VADFRPADTVVATRLTVSTDLATGSIGFTSDPIQTSILEESLGRAGRGSPYGRLLTEITAAIQRQLSGWFAGAA